MLPEFQHIPGLHLLCSILGKDEDNIEDLILLIGSKAVEPKSIIDILIECNMLESKSRLRSNPQTIRMNGAVLEPIIAPTTILTEDCVLSIGKNSGFKCIYIKIKTD